MNHLSKVFAKAKTELESASSHGNGNWVDESDAVDHAVGFWCREIGYPNLHKEEVVDNYKSFFGNKDIVGWSYQIYRALLIATNNRLMRILSQFTKIPLEQIKEEDFKENVSEAKKETMGKIELVVLISFVLTAIGITVYFLKKNKNNQKVRQPSHYPAGSTPYSQPAEKYILFLVLDAEGSETVVEQIRDSARIELAHPRTLSSSSILQGMWYGKQSDFVKTGLGNIGHNSSQRPQSEYDVYSIQIEMDRYYPGFDSGSSSIDRLEAFERMVGDKRYQVVSVSQRLSEYSTNYLYR